MTDSSLRELSEPIFLIERVFTTLEKANTAAMSFFQITYGTFLGGLDRSIFFWLIDRSNLSGPSNETPGHNQVGWRVESSGELCLVAFGSEGERFVVEVHSRFLD